MSHDFSYLTEVQKERLQGLPFSVLLPIAIPEGWDIAGLDVDVDEDGASCSFGFSKGESRVNFLATNEGIGDPPEGGRSSSHSHPEFGKITVEFEEDGDFFVRLARRETRMVCRRWPRFQRFGTRSFCA